ncbi:MAG TPA: hypothetical protein VIY53_00015 [Acidobacteriaceae bacterium]
MTTAVGTMVGVGATVLVAGFILVQSRFRAASGAGKIIVLGPVFEAVAIAMFAAEHFTAARDLMPIVPHWLPAPLFWTYFVGAALLAAAISFIAWRCVRWSALLLALLFFIIVATLDLPNLPQQIHAHDRFFWILTVRETSFAGGALVLAGSVWALTNVAGTALVRLGRALVAAIMIFYAIEHFLFPRNVPGVPLEKLIPAWMPAPALLSYFIGVILLLAGIGLFFRPTIRIAAASAGVILILLTVFFYLPIFLMEIHTPLAIEGINYVGDTLLFAATVLLAGFGADRPAI